MPDSTPTLSAAILRLAGEVGYATLDWLATAPAAAAAELDQHVASVRADLARCQRPRPARSGRAGRGMPPASFRRATARRGAATSASEDGPAAPQAAAADQGRRDQVAEMVCPDVPFAATALSAEPVVSLQLLLHYASGLVEAAVRDDWWPGRIPEGEVDWACLRLAAVCRLVSQAEADAELHPDLRNLP
jgi:Family of unknown function (DUF6401)